MSDKLRDIDDISNDVEQLRNGSGDENDALVDTILCKLKALSEPEGEKVLEMEKLKDAQVVHVNMLRGVIAKLTPAQIAHLYGGDECAEIVAEINRQHPTKPQAQGEAGTDNNSICAKCRWERKYHYLKEERCPTLQVTTFTKLNTTPDPRDKVVELHDKLRADWIEATKSNKEKEASMIWERLNGVKITLEALADLRGKAN